MSALIGFLQALRMSRNKAHCPDLLELVRELTGEPAVMWGQTRVGFSDFHYLGKMSERNWFYAGFSP